MKNIPQRLFDALLGGFALYITYWFIRYAFVKISILEGVDTIGFLNPLSTIFFPSSLFESFIMLLRLTVHGIFYASCIQYYRSKRAKSDILLFYLLADFFYMSNSLFIGIIETYWLKNEFGWVKYWTWWGIAMHILMLLVSYMLIQYLSTEREKAEVEIKQEPLPVYVRGFHSIIDRFCFLIFGSGMFLLLSRDRRDLFDTKVLMLELGIFLGYLVTEALWNVSPTKVLTGVRVTNEGGGSPTFSQILGRSLSRLIPFNVLSFFFERNWHDTFSGTTVTYISKDHPLIRQTRIIIAVCYACLFLAIWIILGALVFNIEALDASVWNRRGIEEVPYKIWLVCFPFAWFLFMFWLASASYYIQSFVYEVPNRGTKVLVKYALWWLPFFHFSLPNGTCKGLVEDLDYLEKTNTNKANQVLLQRLKGAINRFGQMFIAGYTLILLGFFGDYNTSQWSYLVIPRTFVGVGVLLIVMGILSYAQAIKRFWETNPKPSSRDVEEDSVFL